MAPTKHTTSMLQTSIKFDRGVVKVESNGAGACFHESRCISWWRKAYGVEGECGHDFHESARRARGTVTVVDGSTGLCPEGFGGPVSEVSRAALLDEFRETLRAWRPHVFTEFAALTVAETKSLVGKKGYTCYTDAKRFLLWKWFPAWAEAKGVKQPQT